MPVRDHHARPQQTDLAARTARIAALNDALRRHRTGGRLFLTPGVVALGGDAMLAVLKAVASFTAFGEDNDPYGEHDFGAFSHAGTRLFWKIDYHGRDLQSGSPDPADPAVTTRVLTIMLAEEY